MTDDWESKVRALEAAQRDLRRRLDALDREIAVLREQRVAPPPEKNRGMVDQPPPLPAGPPPLPASTTPVFREETIPAEPKPAPAARPAGENLELKVGKYWLVRIGIFVLLTGLVLLGNLAYQNWLSTKQWGWGPMDVIC